MIEAAGVTKQFQDEHVLAGIDLAVEDGEFVSIVGPSGCGKSTFLRCVAGLEDLSGGSLLIDGHDPSQTAVTEMAFVFQEPNLLPWRRVDSNVALPLELQGKRGPDEASQLARVIERVGLSMQDRRKLPKQLSGGMKMRVSLARALITDPRLMLMDEPFGALDDLLRQQLNEDVMGLWMTARWTTLFVTHNVAEAVFLSNRVVVMSPRPATVVDVFDVPFDFPRELAARTSGPFTSLVAEVTSALRKAAS